MATTPSAIQQSTKNWLEKIVIEFNFCPFARRVWLQEKVAYPVCESPEFEEILSALLAACQELDAKEELETTLLIVPQGLERFATYLDLLSIAEALLEEYDYTGVYQLASFHPQYRFGGTPRNDPSNYTNRSPYPMFHLLREASITEALEHYEDPEEIPERNITLANSKSTPVWEALLRACFVEDK